MKKVSVAKRLSLCVFIASLPFTVIAGCTPKDPGNNSSLTSASEYGEASHTETESGGETSAVQSKDTSTPSSSRGSSGLSPSGTTASKTNQQFTDGIDYGVNPGDYRGRTVRYATWKDPAGNEDGPVVKSFEQKFGIKVQIDVIPQGDYVQRILGMIAAGNSSDIFFNTMEFPANLQCLQPLTTANMNLKDSFWDQTWIEATTFGGKPYCIAPMNNIWGTFDILTYNKKLLQDNGIPSPDDYVKAGAWTYENFEKIMMALKAKNLKGAYIRPDYLAASQGAGFIRYDQKNKKFVNGIDDPMLTNIYKKIAEWNEKGYLVTQASEFAGGKVGMVIYDNFGMKKTGHWQQMPPEWLGYAPLPDYDAAHKAKPSAMFRDWGIIKGAKEPVAAGIFLRYYCDSNNYNFSNTFINTEAASEFFKTVNKKASQTEFHVLFGCGKYMGDLPGMGYTLLNNIAFGAPDQVAASISGKKNDINATISNIQKGLPK